MNDEFKIEEVPLQSLAVPEYLKRNHTDEQVLRCVKSIERHGQYQPIVVSGNEILCGVLVFKAMKAMGMKTILVHDLGVLSEGRKKEIRYLDNQIFDIETWNEFKIKDLLMSLDKIGVEKVGFSEEEVDLLVNVEPPERKNSRNSLFHDQYVCDSCGWTGTEEEARGKENRMNGGKQR